MIEGNLSEEAMLRKKAEDILKKKSSETSAVISEADYLKLFHELEVHQIELEMQNQEIRLARAQGNDYLKLYEEIYDLAAIGHISVLKEGEISKINLYGANMLGKTRLHLIGSRLGFFVSDETKPILNLFLDKVFTGKNKEWCEVSLLVNKKKPMKVLISGTVSRNGNECLATIVNTTELAIAREELILANNELVNQNKETQNRTQELTRANEDLMNVKNALHETNQYLENLLEYANAPIIVLNRQFCIIRFNHAFELLTGWTETEIAGQSVEILFPPEVVTQYMSFIRKAESNDRLEMVEVEILRRDKSIRTVLWNYATIFEKDGHTPIASIAQGQDITDRKQAEDALRESKQSLDIAMAMAKMAWWKMDMATGAITFDKRKTEMLG